MTSINAAAESARENARTSSGQFGAQEHRTPDVVLSQEPSWETPRTRKLLADIETAEEQIEAARFALREEAVLALARNIPVDVRMVVFEHFDDTLEYAHCTDADGEEVRLDHRIADELYRIAEVFGNAETAAPHLEHDEPEPMGMYWLTMDAEASAAHAEEEISKAIQLERTIGMGGEWALRLRASDTWNVRAARAHAHNAGVTRIHLDAKGNHFVVTGLTGPEGTTPFDPSTPDHQAIADLAKKFTGITDEMTDDGYPHFTLEV